MIAKVGLGGTPAKELRPRRGPGCPGTGRQYHWQWRRRRWPRQWQGARLVEMALKSSKVV
jgi:hypothetical protein